MLEICAYSPHDAFRAATAGADRVELCRAPEADGLTPARSDLAAASGLLPHAPVHPIIRPRASFTVTTEDEEVMCEALQTVRELGFPGAVLGALAPIDGRGDAGTEPDWAVLERLLPYATGLALTFHRAFDLVEDQPAALRGLAQLGFARVLTSGRPGRAIDNTDRLAELVRVGADVGISVMAGGSVTAAQVAPLLATGVAEVHASAGGSQGRMSSEEVTALAAAVHDSTAPSSPS